MNDNKEFGYEGEDEAAKYLEKIGYKILNRNFSCKAGELDIIALDIDTDEIVFIEVKSRQQFLFGEPRDAIDINKINHIRRTAEFYAYINDIEDYKFRFDVIEILSFPNEKLKLNHLIQAIDF